MLSETETFSPTIASVPRLAEVASAEASRLFSGAFERSAVSDPAGTSEQPDSKEREASVQVKIIRRNAECADCKI